MKTVTVAFEHGNPSFIGKLIQWWTQTDKRMKDTAYHVEIGFDGTYYSAGQKELMWREARLLLNTSEWRKYSLSVTDEEYNAMLMEAKKFKGMRYDWLNIFGSDILSMNVDSKKKLTCDEGVARVLKLCRFGDWIHEIGNLNPNTLEEYINAKLKRSIS